MVIKDGWLDVPTILVSWGLIFLKIEKETLSV